MSEYLEKDDVWVTQTKLPARVKAFCKIKGFDDCAVVNEELDDQAKKDAVKHEVLHLKNGDLLSEEPAANIEAAIKNGG